MKRVCVAIFLIFTCLRCVYGAAPDFAFPQTVCNDARANIKRASASGDMSALMQNALALVIASNDINSDDAGQMVSLLDSVAGISRTPYKQMLYSVEAQLLTQMYEANRYEVSGRLTTDTLPSNPLLWSESQYYGRVSALIDLSLQDSEMLMSCSCSSYSELLTNKGSVFYPSIYSVLAYRAVNLLSSFERGETVIPFAGAKQSVSGMATAKIEEIYAQMIDKYKASDSTAALCIAYVEYADDCLDMSQRRAYLMTRFDEVKDSPYSTEILGRLNRQSVMPDDYLQMCRRQVERFPDYNRIGVIRDIIERAEQPVVEFSYPGTYVSGEDFVVTAEMSGQWNGKKIKALLYRLADDYKGWESLIGKNGVLSRCKLIASKELPGHTMCDTCVKADNLSLNFGKLPAGKYFVAPSGNGTNALSQFVYNIDMCIVSDIAFYFGASDKYNDDENVVNNYLWVVDNANGKPLKGVKVQIKSSNKEINKTVTTDSNGRVELPACRSELTLTASAKGSTVTDTYYPGSGSKRYKEPSVYTNIYTDLGLYHPGDTLQFAVITYRSDGRQKSLITNRKVWVALSDPSGNQIGKKELVSDEYGRVSDSFVLPKSIMAGHCTLTASVVGEIMLYDFLSVPVEYYSLPTFFIDTADMPVSYTLGDTVDICGKVLTYSGMPVGGTDVSIDISYNGYMPYRSMYIEVGRSSYSTSANTLPDGSFSVKLPTESLRGTEFERGNFNLIIKATNAAGESQSTTKTFYIGGGNNIDVHVPGYVEVQKGVANSFTVDVQDNTGRNVPEEVCYTVYSADGTEVLSGKFMSPKCEVDFGNCTSGKYKMRFALCDDSAVSTTDEFVLWRRTDKKPAVETALWVPQTEIEAAKDAKDVSVVLGSTYPDSHILCVIIDDDADPEYRWIKADASTVNLKVTAPQPGDKTHINLVTWHNAVMHTSDIMVKPSSEVPTLRLTCTTFRDKIYAGSMQDWHFTLDYNGKPVTDAAGLVTLSNKALQAICPFKWNEMFRGTNTKRPTYFHGYGSRSYQDMYARYTLSVLRGSNVSSIEFPDINMWGESLYYRYGRYRNIYLVEDAAMTMGSPVMAKQNSVMRSSAVSTEEYPDDAGVDHGVDIGDIDSEEEEEMPRLRDAVTPLAYFNPTLVSHDSALEISFRAPDVNTTWQMQLMAYTPQLQSVLMTHDIVANKPLMVQGNFPRFVRTGDKVQLRATVYNNTDTEQNADCRFEIFNPTTGELMLSHEPPRMQLQPMRSEVFSIDYDVPADAQLLGIRIYAAGTDYQDGEQVLMSVLPSSSLVVESTPFYLQPDSKSLTVSLKNQGWHQGSRTLIYCDNPVWSCLTALPDVNRLPSDVSLSSLLQNLYGTSVSVSLLEKYPQAADSVRSWLDTHSPMLVSQLQKNESVKLRMLSQTPWGENAEAQTLRMARLYTLLDKDYANSVVTEDIRKILGLQNEDGGFSWCPGMPSSEFMTARFITTMARMQHLDAMPQDKGLEQALNRAIAYCDSEIVKSYERDPKHFSYLSMLNYLYARQLAGNPKPDAKFGDIRSKAYAKIAQDWKKMDIYSTATAAMVLNEEGTYKSLAKNMLESLRQRAVTKPDRGMYYANLTDDWYGHGQMLTTTRVLQAFDCIQPQATSVDLLRQWLLLQRQTNEWGECSDIPEVIYTLLQTGSDWTQPNAEPTRIYLGDKLIVSDAGLEVYMPISATDGNTLRIERSGGHPSWGAVVENYLAPSAEVKRFAIPDLSVSKALFVVDGDNVTQIPLQAGVKTLKIGQTIRVQLTIRSQRDMDYVLLNDPLASCMQPVSQLSGYSFSDGLYGYRENGQDYVARYINHLPRGIYTISYDCYVTQEGEFTLPVCTVQSQYAPQMTAHTEGGAIIVAP